MALRGTAGQANTSSSTTVVVDVSGVGIQNNDLVLLFGVFGGTVSSPTWPSGFVSIPSLTNIFNAQLNFAAAYKIASGEPTSYTITPGNTNNFIAQCRVYSGRNTSSPFSAVASTGLSGSSQGFPATYGAVGVTAVSGDDLLTVVGVQGANASDTITFTAPAGCSNTLNTQADTNSFQPYLFSSDEINVAAGATGTISTTATDSNGKSLFWAAFTVSLAAGSSGSVLVFKNASNGGMQSQSGGMRG